LNLNSGNNITVLHQNFGLFGDILEQISKRQINMDYITGCELPYSTPTSDILYQSSLWQLIMVFYDSLRAALSIFTQVSVDGN
jgi:hypothetical protein